jgi:hypothetical protein
MRLGRCRGGDRSRNFKHDRRNVSESQPIEFRIMVKAPALLLVSLALAGCAMTPRAQLASETTVTPRHYAWDGVGGEDPNRPKRTAARAVPGQDATGPDQDAQLNQSLVICKGCLRSPPSEDARLAKASE